MIESPVVEKWKAQWIAEGIAEGRRQVLLRILGRRFPGNLPQPITDAIATESDLDALARWLDAAVEATALDEVRAAIGC